MALLTALGMAARLRSEGCGAGRSPQSTGHENGGGESAAGEYRSQPLVVAVDKAVELAETTANELITEASMGGQKLARSQAGYSSARSSVFFLS